MENVLNSHALAFSVNMNLKDVQRKNCCKQCRHFKFNGTMTKWQAQKQTHRTAQKHTEQHDVTDINKNNVCALDKQF